MFGKPLLSADDYTVFTNDFKTLALLVGLLLVLSIFANSLQWQLCGMA